MKLSVKLLDSRTLNSATRANASNRMMVRAGMGRGIVGNSPLRYTAAVAEDTVDVATASSSVAAAPISPIVFPENCSKYV